MNFLQEPTIGIQTRTNILTLLAGKLSCCLVLAALQVVNFRVVWLSGCSREAWCVRIKSDASSTAKRMAGSNTTSSGTFGETPNAALFGGDIIYL